MKLTVYWRQHCPACRELLYYLERKGVPYEGLDVTHDAEHFAQMMRLGGFATPYMVLDGQPITYFDPEKLDVLLSQNNGDG
ncbi:glutaredoxin domain-containing protein [Paenibacillus sp. YYML68]|uniref:glutaredoxin family protein n=1 Tax=Paenibacillus sp. YYML68 TaxID=2909250 RepID=UPI0024923CF9|nr:glutaredoxin domain-containing protein [Paenibacillus sp. YYML68]